MAVILSVVLHGSVGWWWFRAAMKYQQPVLHSVKYSTLRFDVVDSPSKANEVVSPAEEFRSSSEAQRRGGHHESGQILNLGQSDFLGIDEVDVPAKPVGEWVIDFSKWSPGRSQPIIIEMWISATGKLEHWELVSDTQNREIAAMSLRQLDETPINPAILNGKRVASYRRIEIILNVDP